MVEADAPADLEAQKKEKERIANAMRCPKGCKVVSYLNGFKRRVNAQGLVVQPRSLEERCHTCKESFQVHTEKGFSSCKSTCNFFLCARCSKCGHCSKILMRSNKQHRSYASDENNWAYCSLCSNYFNYKNEPASKKWYYMCSSEQCDFAACRTCIIPIAEGASASA